MLKIIARTANLTSSVSWLRIIMRLLRRITIQLNWTSEQVFRSDPESTPMAVWTHFYCPLNANWQLLTAERGIGLQQFGRSNIYRVKSKLPWWKKKRYTISGSARKLWAFFCISAVIVRSSQSRQDPWRRRSSDKHRWLLRCRQVAETKGMRWRLTCP